MSVQLTPPHTLGFRRPLTQLVQRTLTVANANDKPVAFKVKTTAPKLYCVRPNSGRIEPGESVEVQVMLQAMKEEPPLAAKCKDKFLIQSTFITPNKETMNLKEIWDLTDDSNEESRVHQQKVKVAYLAAEGTIDEEDEAAGMSSMMTNGDTSHYETVRPGPNGHSAPMPDFNAEKSLNELTDHEGDRPHTPPEAPLVSITPPPPMPAPAPAPAPAPVSMPVPVPAVAQALVAPIVGLVSSKSSTTSQDEAVDLKNRLAEAEAELSRMRALLQSMPDPSLGAPINDNGPEPSVAPSQSVTEAGMRRRQRVLSDASSTAYTRGDARSVSTGTTDADYKVEVPEGVPLPVVIAVALGVFVTTYLFF